jgi:hypothetical protein
MGNEDFQLHLLLDFPPGNRVNAYYHGREFLRSNPLIVDQPPDPSHRSLPDSDMIRAFSTWDAAMTWVKKEILNQGIVDMSSYGHPAVIGDWWREEKPAPTP